MEEDKTIHIPVRDLDAEEEIKKEFPKRPLVMKDGNADGGSFICAGHTARHNPEEFDRLNKGEDFANDEFLN